MPWKMFEISPEYKVDRVFAAIRKAKNQVFHEKAGQVFAPVNAEGELKLGYFFARGNNRFLTAAMTRLRGVCEVSSLYDDQGKFKKEVTIPHMEVQAMIDARSTQRSTRVKVGEFVEVLTGDASRYCGTVRTITKISIHVEINFPSGRKFLIHAQPSSVKSFGDVPKEQRGFWGLIR